MELKAMIIWILSDEKKKLRQTFKHFYDKHAHEMDAFMLKVQTAV